MKFTISQSSFLALLQSVSGAAEGKSTIPILGSVLLDATHDGITATATNLDLTMSAFASEEVQGPGAICLPAKKLAEIVASLKGEQEITLTTTDTQAIVTAGRSKFKVGYLHKDMFPDVQAAPVAMFRFPAPTFAQMLARVAFAITMEESRYTLAGAKLLLAGGVMRIVATDGHRLSFIEANAPNANDVALDVLVPRKAVQELAKLCAVDGEVEIGLAGDNHIAFRVDGVTAVSRLLSGQFPDYEKVLPPASVIPNKITVDRAALLASVRRVGLMADDRSHAIKFAIGDNRIELSSQSAEMGEAADTLPVEYAGQAVEIGFNAAYIADFLAIAQSEQVTMEFGDGNAQVLLRPVGDSGVEWKVVIMPMRF